MSDFLQGKLDNQEIRKKLSEYKYVSGFRPSDELINDIIDQFRFHDFYNSLISDEFFLNHLLHFLDREKPKEYNRFEFYSFLFDQIAKVKKDRLKLQRIALTFEQIQSDAMLPSDYEELLKVVEASEDLFGVDWMKKNHFAKIGEREGRRLFIWEHHTLTEFLVAERLLGKENPIEAFQKLAILEQEGITAFKPSWSGVLRFLTESEKAPEIISWLVGFLGEYSENIDDNLSELLMFVDINVADDIRRRIFDLIYSSYFERLIWLPAWTRRGISKFVDEASYERLKNDIKKWPDQTETFVKRGNAVAVIGGLLEDESQLVAQDKAFWETTLVDFVNNPQDGGNGVLQRRSLDALARLKKPSLIPLVESAADSSDSLVRDAFIQFCIESDPDSHYAIDHFIKGIKNGSDIYARHGLYKITKKDAIKYFLEKVSEDEAFWKSFLGHESIFDKEDGDQQLIANIRKHLDKQTNGLLKRIIFRIFRIPNYCQEEKSNFIKQIARLIYKHDPGYIFEVLNDIKKEKDEQKIDRLFYDSKELLAALLTKDNVKQGLEALEEFSARAKRGAQYAVYTARRINGEVGEQVYREAVKLGFVEEVEEARSQKYIEEQEAKRKQDVAGDFQKLLEPSPGKYNPSVFGYYLQNKKELDEFFEAKEGEKAKKRLVKLAVSEGVKKIDPKEIKVSIPDKKTRQFSWSSVASYYGDLLSAVKILAPEEIDRHRQRIIDFIPYAFPDDMSLIMDLIPKIKDEELEFINKVMSDGKDDRRYLIPGTYIYLAGHYAKNGCKLPSVLSVLKSFVGDERIPDYEQRATLENLAYFIDEKDKETEIFLQSIFEKSEDKELVKAANTLLITIYKDGKAIEWRFDQLKTPIKFDQRKLEGKEHSVGFEERELDTMAFAKPLFELKEEKYLEKFFKLLDYSFDVLKEKETEQEKKEYWEYVNYLWRIVIAFVENLKEKRSFSPLLELEDWASKHSDYENANWLKARIRELRKVYINQIGIADTLKWLKHLS